MCCHREQKAGRREVVSPGRVQPLQKCEELRQEAGRLAAPRALGERRLCGPRRGGRGVRGGSRPETPSWIPSGLSPPPPPPPQHPQASGLGLSFRAAIICISVFLSFEAMTSSQAVTLCSPGVSRVRVSSGRSRANVTSLSDLVAAGWQVGCRLARGREACLGLACVYKSTPCCNCRLLNSAKSCLIDGNNCF